MNVNPLKSIHCIVEKRKNGKRKAENTNTKEEEKGKEKGRGGAIHYKVHFILKRNVV